MNPETVLITGASSGIGLELATCFAADGCRLILVARNVPALEELATALRQAHKIEVRVLAADLAQPEAPARLFGGLKAEGVEVDVLINNAGFGAHGTFNELPLQTQLDMVQVNINALVALTGLFLPGMVGRRRGGVMNIASTAAFQAGPRMAVYYATKAFVLSFSEAIGEELAGSGVTVTAVCPGPTHTNFGKTAKYRGSSGPLRAAMTASAVAREAHHAFRQGRIVFINGWQNFLPTLLVRLLPRIVIRKVVKRLIATRESKD